MNESHAPLVFPPSPAALPATSIKEGRYRVRFARSSEELDRIQRLRYEIFNVELDEGLEASHITGRDNDRFDAHFHHMMLVQDGTDEIVGTYRLQTSEMARDGVGFYSADEFDLSAMPDDVRDASIELGRTCIAPAHRKQRALLALWRGLAAYLVHNRKRYLFGCCSLTSQDPAAGVRLSRHLERAGHLHPTLRIPARAGYRCVADGPVADDATAADVPGLFAAYLRYGTKVCSEPAIDREFKTIDWLVVCDIESLDPATYAYFFG